MVLQERGVNTAGMKADALRECLRKHADFNKPKTLLEEYVQSRGHLCYFPQNTTVNSTL